MQPRHGGAGGEAAAGGSRRCSCVCIGLCCLPGSPVRQQVRGGACIIQEVTLLFAQGSCERQKQCGCCKADILVTSNGTGLVFGISRAWHWVNCFIPLWSPVGTLVGVFCRACSWHGGGLLPSWDSRLVCLLLIQKGCSGMGWLEFCLCLDPGLEQGWFGYKEHADMEVKHLEEPFLFSPNLCS